MDKVAMDKAVSEKVRSWLDSDVVDEETKKEIRRMMNKDDKTEIIEAFYKDLEFGTGGLRGIMGAGTNRMNKYTVASATQGLANYLKKSFPGTEIKVAIAHDSRNQSDFFTKTAAAILSANGITVFIFEDLRPTPILSYAVRKLGCQSGIVITASHNPREYNGYKAYWNDGAQMVPPHDKNTILEVNGIKNFNQVNFNQDDGKIKKIGKDIDESYLEEVAGLVLSPGEIKKQKNLKIVYSSLHGSGITLVPKVLEKIGFTNLHLVEEQSMPDGNFPTVKYPNPEETEAMTLALKKAREIDADIIMATDPDADRVGIGTKNHHGEFQLLNGNQTGALLIYYELKKWKELNRLDGNQYIVKTIVTTDMIDAIAAKFNVACYNVLTGFKYIAEIIRNEEGNRKFIAGGEESYGYLVGDFVRDKDAVSACAVIAEMTAYARDKGMTLMDMLLDIYMEYGQFMEKLVSLERKGKSGSEEIKTMMMNLRENPPKEIAGSKLVKVSDYLNRIEKDIAAGKTTAISLPQSDVLQFFTADGTKISARPSGTEPKIKFYISAREKLARREDYDKVTEVLDARIGRIVKELGVG
ncbi:MAG TPA: phospho-sugar mutase [Cyclobacteriaceae bacterium]|nr:phospho-sugar mutase [Cyclobacteriaceae bacterium]